MDCRVGFFIRAGLISKITLHLPLSYDLVQFWWPPQLSSHLAFPYSSPDNKSHERRNTLTSHSTTVQPSAFLQEEDLAIV